MLYSNSISRCDGGPQVDGNFLFGLPAIAAMLAVVLALWGLFYLIDHLAEKNLNKNALGLMLIACGFCILSTVLFSIEPSWDYGVVLRSSMELARDGSLTDTAYFSRYPFQVLPALIYDVFYEAHSCTYNGGGLWRQLCAEHYSYSRCSLRRFFCWKAFARQNASA